MTKSMAEVLTEHSLLSHERSGTHACSNPDCGWEFRYRLRMADLKNGVDVVLSEFAAHQAAALSAAGFGLVADAKGEALEEAAAELTWVRPESSPCGDIESCCGSSESCDAMRPSVFTASPAWLRARAASIRGEQ